MGGEEVNAYVSRVLKWKLMLTTLPYVAAVAALKIFIDRVLHFEGVVEFGEMGVVLTAGVFLTGFMLAGTMGDYKESERLPGELACTLETIEEVLVQASAAKQSIAPGPMRASVGKVVGKIQGWLRKRNSIDELFAELTALHGVIMQVERDGAGGYASRAVSELNNLRRTITRINVISRTGFLPPAYALLETLLGIILLLVLMAKFKTPLAMTILVPFITLIYVYMLRLIRDIDDPFDYAPDGQKSGGAEVDLTPLDAYQKRLAARG
jgi:hypothetical protein